jgi:hypothetical protein
MTPANLDGCEGSGLISQLLSRGRLEGLWFKISQDKKLARLHLNKKWDVLVILAMWGA